MTDPTTAVSVNRHALIRGKYEDLERIKRCLPDNYHIALNPGVYGEGILIEGHDVAGWTLDDYVLPRLASALLFGSEVFYCSSCASHDHNVGDCPDQIPVYAVNVNGEEWMLVAHERDGLRLMDGTHASYGQCGDCGSFDSAGEPVAFTVHFLAPRNGHVTCDGCGRRYPIVTKPSKEVCF